MTRRAMTAFLLTGIILLLLAPPLFAGGWAVVTVDQLPQHLRAGAAATLGFTVRQHGQHPVNLANVTLQATNPTSGQTLTFTARQEGGEGHYVVEVLLPQSGLWQWQIHPDWFPPVEMAPMPVVDDAPVTNETATVSFTLSALLPWLLTAIGALLLSSAALSPRFSTRRFRLLAGGLGLLVVVGGLGWAAVGARLPQTVAAQSVEPVSYGRALFMAKGCNTCHLHSQARNAWTTEIGPNLTHYQNTAEYLHVWLKDPKAIKPNTLMPNLGLKADEIAALAAFLTATKQ